jgi:PLP dependent protein
LIAVSKLKPTQDIIEVYNNGQQHFGENYVKELVKKSNSEDIIASCPNIKWHFIGKNNNLYCIVTTYKLDIFFS